MPEIQNPNLQSGGSGGSGGSDQRSWLVWVFLAVAVFLGFQYFQKPKPSAPEATQQQTAPASVQPMAGTSRTPSAQPSGASAKGPAAPSVANVMAAAETETTVENANYKIVFTNRGAVVKHWILKHYYQSDGKTPLDMVQPQAAAQFGFPLSLFTYDTSLTAEINGALYQPSATGPVAPTDVVTFHMVQNGVEVVKSFRFDPTYVIAAEAQVKRNGQVVRSLIAWPAGLGDQEEFQGRSSIPGLARTPSTFNWLLSNKDDSEAGRKLSNNATLEGDYQYAGAADLYFAAAFLPQDPQHATVVTFHNAIDLPTDLANPNSEKKPADVIGLAVGDTSGYNRVRLYVGPKQMDLVSSIHSTGSDGKADGPTLRPLIEFGWLTIIATPLFWALRFLFDHGIPNWGWDIIVLTVLFNLLLLPTRLMMMKSSLKMMRIQPKVDAIKRKYSNLKPTDPKRAEMNTEMMALYKTEGVNMYGGCLPMLLQMPLFFAYFRVLQNTVELRQAHWYWLHDLSAPDPMHILPILIILSMFLTQFITPSPGMDPAQRRMMAIMMPVIFGFTLWHYASGLALYWGTGNLIMLSVQLVINQSHIGREMHAIAAKRAAKRAGKNPPTISGRR